MSINYKPTTIGCFVGVFTQAIITNVTPVLFVPMMSMYGFDYKHLGILVAVNFITQVAIDILFSGMIDKLGYKKICLPTCAISFFGLLVFSLSPTLFSGNEFVGIMLATIIMAASGGLLEILLSPIIAAIPSDNKGAAMSLMHSFYAWGQVVTIIVTTLFVFIFGKENWTWLVLFWALVPLTNFFIFAFAPMPPTVPEEKRDGMRKLLFKPFYLMALVAIFAGAGTELVISQWASTFMEKGLELPKLAGDLLGMCGFAVMLGIGRTAYGVLGSRLDMSKSCIVCSAVGIACYIVTALSPIPAISVAACALCGIAASLLWPGTIVIATLEYPFAGAWMFAFLAAAGDIGGAFAPWVTGVVVDAGSGIGMVHSIASSLNISVEQASIRMGLLVAAIFPLVAFIAHIVIRRIHFRNKEKE